MSSEAAQADSLLRLVTDTARIGLVLVDEARRYRFANPTYSEILGLPPGDLVGRRVADVMAPVYEQDIRPRLERAFAGERVAYELRMPVGGGRSRVGIFSVTYQPRLDDPGGPCVAVIIVDVTDQKLVEESLRRSERALNLALETARAVAWSYDVQSDTITVGDHVEELFGLLPGQRLEKVHAGLALVHPDDVAQHREKISPAMRQPGRYTSRFRLRRPRDGRYVWLEEHGQSLLVDGRMNLIGMTVDVSDRVEAEAAIRHSEQRFRGIVDQSLAGIAEVDAQGRFTIVNDRFCAISGRSREELLGLSLYDITDPDDLARQHDPLERLRISRQPYEIEKRYVRADGSRVWVHNSVSGIFDDAGGLARMIAICVDISERKRAEESLRYRTEQYAMLLNQAPLGVYVVDADFRLREVNPVARPAFGDIPDLIGRDFDDVLRIVWGDDLGRQFGALFRRTLTTGESFDEPELIRERNDRGEVESYRFRVDRITLPDGRYGAVCYFSDISRLVQARMTLAKQADELRRANVDLAHFASIASHDLQEPLRMISSFTDILAKKYRPLFDERAMQYFERITNGAERMRSLINALLTYSKVGRTQLVPEDVPMGEVLDEVVDLLQHQVAAKSARITADPLPKVRGNRARLSQLIQNLVANALKFTLPERSPVVHLGVSDERTHWRFTVADNGIGIAQDAQERVFQIFQRLHPVDEYPGSGIGLATCKRIAEQHGGRIGVESVPGRGSTFWFTLKKDPEGGAGEFSHPVG